MTLACKCVYTQLQPPNCSISFLIILVIFLTSWTELMTNLRLPTFSNFKINVSIAASLKKKRLFKVANMFHVK